jgi:hypothetical protein
VLGTVINKLSENKPGVHIPYRNSSLTKVLASGLGGNSNTAVVAALSPALWNVFESRNTLLVSAGLLYVFKKLCKCRDDLISRERACVVLELPTTASDGYSGCAYVQFASRAAKIVNRTAKVVLHHEASTIDKYKREIEVLKSRLGELESKGLREVKAEKRLQEIEDIIRISSKVRPSYRTPSHLPSPGRHPESRLIRVSSLSKACTLTH